MNCPSCSTPLEPGARFCGVCGYRLEAQGPRTPAAVPGTKGAGGTLKQSGGAAPKPSGAAERTPRPAGPNVVPRNSGGGGGAAPVQEAQYRAQTPAAGSPVRAAIPASGSAPKPKPNLGGTPKPRGPIAKD